MLAPQHRTYYLGHITELYLLSDNATREFQRAVPALVALFKMHEAQQPGTLRSAWPQLQFSDKPGNCVMVNGVPFTSEQLIESVRGMGIPAATRAPRDTYRLEHITDLVQLADEHIAAFQADVPTLVATLQLAAAQHDVVNEVDNSLAGVFPHLTFAPELGEAVLLRTDQSTPVLDGADVRAAANLVLETPTNGVASTMNPDFKTAAEALIAANEQFAAGKLSPVGHRDAREAALASGLVAMAEDFGVKLQQPLHVDSRGELRIVALHPDGRSPEMGCGQFGAFAEKLSQHQARTGVAAGHIAPENGWCLMNHFDVSRMLMSHYNGTPAASLPDQAAAPEAPRRKARP
tara:strand:- start:1843 stop:2886 length:1044 start_codon:yes stop_codon:yes gene_type:complete